MIQVWLSFLSLLSLLFFPIFAIADIYKWVDEEGVVHFADDINKVPLKYRPERIPGKMRPEGNGVSFSQTEWERMSHDEKMEYLRRLSERKRMEDESKMASYPAHVQALIREHGLEVGMTKEMVRLSRGSPNDILFLDPERGREKWVYVTFQPLKISCLYFENDILVRWEE